MPKNTFSQLPHEKKERLLRAAAVLFADKGFHQTDVAEIASRAAVAKGSIYNYFDSKHELYFHVCRDGLERSRQVVYGGLGRDWPVFRQIEHIFRHGVEFTLCYPEYVKMYLNISSTGMEQFAEDMTLEVEKHTSDYLKSLLQRGQGVGDVRRDLDVKMGAFLINSLYVIFMASLVSRHYQIRLMEYLELPGDLDEPTVQELLGMVIDLIKHILEPPQTAGGADLN